MIISFGNEAERLEEYDKIVKKNSGAATRAAIAGGVTAGLFMFIGVGSSLYAWVIAGIHFEVGFTNPKTGEMITLEEVFTAYQAMGYGIMSFLSVTNLIAPFYRLRLTGRIVLDLIDRQSKIQSIEEGAI